MKIILASGNQGKHQEILHSLADLPLNVHLQSEFDVSEADEPASTFVENALLKARNACQQTGHAALADDSGIVVDALQGAPGVHSAYYAGTRNPTENNQKVLAALDGISEEKRQAHFVCVLTLLRFADDPDPIICHGSWHGRILFEPVGERGFGYDPIFWVPSKNCSAAELDLTQKNQLSHRGQALQALRQALSQIV